MHVLHMLDNNYLPFIDDGNHLSKYERGASMEATKHAQEGATSISLCDSMQQIRATFLPY